ncbi:MAG: putative metallopeptidase [Patescibacteria group bacterium]|nr:putative metallopeptidase [Patescibacteria group bacterium]
MKYQQAPEIKQTVSQLINQLKLKHINPKRIFCIRSFDAKTHAVARIWGMAKIFKEVAGIEPCYIIEVNTKRFDKLPEQEKIKTLIHELMHIPKTFSGALLSHRGKYHRINDKEIEKLIKKLK